MNSLLSRIDAYVNDLDDRTREALDQITIRKLFRKGDYLLPMGEVSRFSYQIDSGVARKFYLTDKREITTEFYFPQDIALSLFSYTTQTASREAIQALTDTVTYRTDYCAFQGLKSRFPALFQLDLLLTEYYAIWLEERLVQFHTLSAMERYRHLLHTQPQVIRTIQLTYIASYLGISLETLSRIRASL